MTLRHSHIPAISTTTVYLHCRKLISSVRSYVAPYSAVSTAGADNSILVSFWMVNRCARTARGALVTFQICSLRRSATITFHICNAKEREGAMRKVPNNYRQNWLSSGKHCKNEAHLHNTGITSVLLCTLSVLRSRIYMLHPRVNWTNVHMLSRLYLISNEVFIDPETSFTWHHLYNPSHSECFLWMCVLLIC